jgi:signal transduction histidine kinase
LRRLFNGLGWRRIGATALTALAAAVLLTVPGMSPRSFPGYLIATSIFSFAVVLALTVAGNLPQGRVPQPWLNLGAVVLASVLGTLLIVFMRDGDPLRLWRTAQGRESVLYIVLIGLVVGLASSTAMLLRERQTADRARHEARERLLERQVLESRLRLLQAQVEPHFLFNTLANVEQLVTSDPPTAATLLHHLCRYLRVTLPDMREPTSTLGREADIAHAYLSILQVRMGERLAFDMAVPQALRDTALPPMMLLTLVENAVEHGVADQARGQVSVSALATEGRLRVTVADNGPGFALNAAPGVGLANLRERLAALYDGQAMLRLEEAPAGSTARGVRATIDIPLTSASPTSPASHA